MAKISNPIAGGVPRFIKGPAILELAQGCEVQFDNARVGLTDVSTLNDQHQRILLAPRRYIGACRGRIACCGSPIDVPLEALHVCDECLRYLYS